MKTLFAALFVLLCGISQATATTVAIPGENISIDIPDTWTAGGAGSLPPGNTLLYSAGNTKEGSELIIASVPNDRNISINQADTDSYERQVLNAVEVGGASAFENSKSITTIDGVPAYYVALNIEGRGRPAYGRKYVIAANRKFYKIVLLTLNSTKDSELKEIAASFHFTTPPVLPGAEPDAGSSQSPAASPDGGTSVPPNSSSSSASSWLKPLLSSLHVDTSGINIGDIIILGLLLVGLLLVAWFFKGDHGMLVGIFRAIGFMIAMELLVFVLMGAWILFDGLHDDYDHADVALVPGYAETKDGNFSTSLTARLDRAVELYKKGKFTYVIVSGVTPPNEQDETEAMARYLQDHGVPANVIIQDHRGLNANDTIDNVAGIMKEQKMHSLLLVTDYYRITRLKIALQHAGVKDFEQTHTGEYKKEDNITVLQEDYHIYKSFYDWYGGPAMDILKTDMQKAEDIANEKINSSTPSQPASDSSTK